MIAMAKTHGDWDAPSTLLNWKGIKLNPVQTVFVVVGVFLTVILFNRLASLPTLLRAAVSLLFGCPLIALGYLKPHEQPLYWWAVIAGRHAVKPKSYVWSRSTEGRRAVLPKAVGATQKLLDLRRISGGVIELNSGGYASVIKVWGVNVALLEEVEKDLVEEDFKEFLNALTFPVQILVRQRLQDVDDYLDFVSDRASEHGGNPQLREYCLQYGDWVDDTVENSRFISKHRYIVIPYLGGAAGSGWARRLLGRFRGRPDDDPDFDTPADTLHRRTEAVMGHLRRMGLKHELLDEKGLKELIYSSWNPLLSEIQRPAPTPRLAVLGGRSAGEPTDVRALLEALAAEDGASPGADAGPGVLSRFREAAAALRGPGGPGSDDGASRDLAEGAADVCDIAPSCVKVTDKHLLVGERYCSVIMVTDLPDELSFGWLSDVYSYGDDCDVSIHIEHVTGNDVFKALRRRIQQLTATVTAQERSQGYEDPEDAVKLAGAWEFAYALREGQTKPFRTSIYIAVYANRAEDLEKKRREIEGMLGSRTITSRSANLQQFGGFVSVLPIGKNELRRSAKRNMGTAALATVFPFANESVYDPGGMALGMNPYTGDFVICDTWDITQYNQFNSITVGAPGGGKSMKQKKINALNRGLCDSRVLCIDPKGEYAAGALALGGQVLSLGSGSRASFVNPLDLPASRDAGSGAEYFRNKVIFLHGLFDVIADTRQRGSILSVEAHNAIDDAIRDTYRDHGITAAHTTHGSVPPLLSDLVETLGGRDDPGAVEVLKYVGMFIGDGTYAGLFDHHTTVDLSNPYVVIDLSTLAPELWPIAMYVVLDFVWNDITSGELRKTILVVDEAWCLMDKTAIGEFLARIARLGRQYYTGLHVITQRVPDFLRSRYGEDIIGLSALQWIMKLEHNDIDEVVRGFKLTDSQEAYVRGLKGKGEALLIVEDGSRLAITVMVSDWEMELFTTDPRHRLAMEQAAGLG